MAANVSLAEWAEQYLRARDAFERAIISLKKDPQGLLVTYKKRELVVPCQETLAVEKVPPSGHVLLVVKQSKANFDLLVKGFAALAKNPDLTVAFANTRSNEKWLVKPHVHSGVADPASLKAGLLAMYQTVAE